MLHRIRSFVRNLLAPGRADDRLRTEMEGFVDLLAAEQRANGVAGDDALRRARMAAGGSTQVMEAVRDVRAGAAIEMLVRDLRFAARRLANAPVFTLTTVVTLALGLGASIVVLAITDAVLLRPLRYADPERLVTVLEKGTDPVSPANYLDWKASLDGKVHLEAAEYWTPTLTDGEAEKVDALHVTPGMMRMLGVPPALGPGFTLNVDAAAEIIIGDALWRRRYGADPAVIGRTIVAEGIPHVVVGVMPRDFQFAPYWATDAQLWAPLPLAGQTSDRTRSSLRLFGRLAPGVDLATARANLDLVTSRLAVAFPETNKDIHMLPLREKAIGNVRPALYALGGAVAFVILIMWVNVAHMLVARAFSHERELRLRVALGASRARLLRETLLESALLASGGGLLATTFASAALGLVRTRGPFDLPQLVTLDVDGRVAIIAAALVVVTSLIVAILPASLANAAASAPTLSHATRGATADAGRARTRQLLTATEMAFAAVLLVGTGLMVRTFAAMRAIDPGFDAAGLVTMQVPVPATATTAARRLEYFNGIAERLGAVPGVASAAFINHLPLAGDEWGVPTFGGTNENGGPGDGIRAVYRVITPGLLATMRISIDQGRDVHPTDDLAHPPVIIVNERLARRMWPNTSAIGRRLAFSPAGEERTWLTVVGVAENVKQADWTAESADEVYLPYGQSRGYLEGSGRATGYLTLVVRSTLDAGAVAAVVRDVAARADRAKPVTDIVTMTAVVDRMTARARFLMMVLLGFAILAVALAAVGIYGVMSYAVAQRRQEIGIRIALGADARAIARVVMGQVALMSGVGLSIGLVSALGLTRFVAGQLYGVPPRDPVSFAAAGVVLGATALLATVGPLMRARRVDPVTVMRGEG